MDDDLIVLGTWFEAVKLNLPDAVQELEDLRLTLAREHKASVRTDEEAATLVAQVNVARADFAFQFEALACILIGV